LQSLLLLNSYCSIEVAAAVQLRPLLQPGDLRPQKALDPMPAGNAA
jgi:hypothetical protein